MGDEEVHTRLGHRRVDLRKARYLGGHPQRPRAEPTRFLYLTAKGVEFRTGLTPVTMPWDTVSGLVIAGPAELEGWPLTPGDLSTSGGSVSYLRVDAEIGSPMFEVPGLTPDDLRGKLEPVAHLVALPDVLVAPGSSTPSADADLDTRQMEAFGLEGLVDPATDAEDAAASEVESPPDDGTVGSTDEAEPTGEEPSEDETDVSQAEVDESAASPDAAAVETVEDAPADEASPVEEAVFEDEAPPLEGGEATDGDETPHAGEPTTESVDSTSDDAESSEEPSEPAADAQNAEREERHEAVAEVPEHAGTTSEDASVDARDDILELDAALAELVDAADPVDAALDIADVDLELDDLQLTALGIDAPSDTNGQDGLSHDTADTVLPAVFRCPNGHTNPDGTRFCLQCGAPIQGPACPQGHPNPPGAAFCGECGTSIESSAHPADTGELAMRYEAVRDALETLTRMRRAQQKEVAPLLRKVGSLTALASDQRVLPLRKSLHEQHITAKRAELSLAEAQRDAGGLSSEEADALVTLRAEEVDFAIQMLLEVTELIALPGNDEEGKDLVRQHMSGIFSECDEKRRSAQLQLAQVRGEPHAIRAAELESDVVAKRGELSAKRSGRKPNARDVWRLEDELLGLQVSQLSERRAAAIAKADVAATDEADALLAIVRDEAKEHAEHAPAQTEKISRFEAEMMTTMATVFTGSQRVPRSADRRVAAAKRAVAEFRDFFDTHPAPAIGVGEKLLDDLAAEWEEYNRLSRMVVGTTTVVPGRSSQRTRVQWIKYDQMIVNAWVRRVGVISAEIEVSQAAGTTERTDGLVKLLEVISEAVKLSSSAAKIEVPAV